VLRQVSALGTERDRLLAITSPDESRHRPVYKRLDEVVLIGRAIWAWREL
jgi:hypothetical protein